MPLPTLPQFPQRNSPNFADEADSFVAALPAWGAAANALEQSLQLVATTATSATGLAVATGSRSLTTLAGKAWAIGSWVYIVSGSSVANLMYGQVTAYNSVTGALTVNVTHASGSGTHADWVIGLSVPMDGSPVFSGTASAAKFQVDPAFHMSFLGPDPAIQLDTNDYIYYNRTPDTFGVVIANIPRFTVDATNGPQRPNDASTGNGLVRKSQMDSGLAAVALGGFRGLSVSASGSNASISIGADSLMLINGSGSSLILSNLAITTSTASIDTGSLASNTWYSVWVISNGTITDARISLSSTAPTMPAGYTYKARVGWVRTDGTANKFPLGFVQKGRRAQYVVGSGNVSALPVLASGSQGSVTAPTWVSASVSSSAPPTAGAVFLTLAGGSAGSISMAAPNASYGPYSSTTNPPPVAVNAGQMMSAASIVLESTNVYYASNSGVSGLLMVSGWEDNL